MPPPARGPRFLAGKLVDLPLECADTLGMRISTQLGAGADQGTRRFRFQSRNSSRFRARTIDLNAALEDGSVFDTDARGLNIADDCAVFLDLHAIVGIDVAGNFAEDDQFARRNFRIQLAAATDGETMAANGDRSFDLAIDLQIFFGADAALNLETGADAGETACGRGSRARGKGVRVGCGFGATLE